MANKYFKDKRSIIPTNQADWKADAVWNGLKNSYPEEIEKIQEMQKKDSITFGKIQPETEKYIDNFLTKVVEDNHRMGRT